MLPPIMHGDLLRLSLAAGDVVAIIDGFFYHRPAVRHQEILHVLNLGVSVIGGASMGAIRAAELVGSGMIGVGAVFEAYLRGVLAGDDEVALLHASAEEAHRPLSLALVSVRDATAHLRRLALINPAQERHVLRALSSTFFADRTLGFTMQLARQAAFSDVATAALRTRVDGTEPDIKQRDARQVVTLASELAGDAHGCGPPVGPAVKTDLLWRWQNECAADAAPMAEPSHLSLVRTRQLFDPNFARDYEGAVLLHLAKAWGVASAREPIAREFIQRTGLAEVTAAMAREWLYPEQTGAGVAPIMALVVATHRLPPGVTLIHDGEWLSSLAESSREWLNALCRACDAGAPETLASPRAALRYVACIWKAPDAGGSVLRRLGYARGFRDLADIADAARPFVASRQTVARVLACHQT
jgi:hypothetical protein